MNGTPGTLGVVGLLARLALRRWANRMTAAFQRKKEGRAGTARKGSGGAVWLVFSGIMILASGLNISYQFLTRLSGELDRRSSATRETVGQGTYWFLEHADWEDLPKLRKDLEETGLYQDDVPKAERATRAERDRKSVV